MPVSAAGRDIEVYLQGGLSTSGLFLVLFIQKDVAGRFPEIGAGPKSYIIIWDGPL